MNFSKTGTRTSKTGTKNSYKSSLGEAYDRYIYIERERERDINRIFEVDRFEFYEVLEA